MKRAHAEYSDISIGKTERKLWSLKLVIQGFDKSLHPFATTIVRTT